MSKRIGYRLSGGMEEKTFLPYAVCLLVLTWMVLAIDSCTIKISAVTGRHYGKKWGDVSLEIALPENDEL